MMPTAKTAPAPSLPIHMPQTQHSSISQHDSSSARPGRPTPSDGPGDGGDSGERSALINEANEQYGDNTIRTSKYTLFSFIPQSLFEQFRRTANVYFLGISMLMIVGTYAPTVFQSPLLPYSTIGPLVLVLAITMVKEALEDYKRHSSDKEVNYRSIVVLRGDGREETVRWIDLRVGNIIRVLNKSEVPADLILLQSSEPQGACYIETSNIDGETNLKIKESVPAVAARYSTAGHLASVKGKVVYEQPNDSIHTFDGRLMIDGSEDTAVGANNMVLRGCTLRNTAWILGLVVFTGAETKVMKKSASARSKMSRIESTVNKCIGIIFATQVVLSIISTILEQQWTNKNGHSAPYLDLGSSKLVIPTWLSQLLTFLVLYNNFIPISLYVTIEMVNYAQALLVDLDASMYDPETNLGQVQYVFSDKTGTLTRNLMEFKMCSIGGVKFGRLDSAEEGADAQASASPRRAAGGATPSLKESFHAPELRELISGVSSPTSSSSTGVSLEAVEEFFKCMSLCHTVVPEANEAGGPAIYQAESPDEGALVGAARDLGYEFVSRTNDSMTIKRRNALATFEVLGIHVFDATRKRMSMVFRTPEGETLLLIKGADNVIMDRSLDGPLNDVLTRHLVDFAKLGLRTLVLAQRYLSVEETERWLVEYKRASNSIVDRAAKLASVAEGVEKDLIVLGATAIEDKLQEGVPETIDSLARAGIKTWVLTGDKVETAINIGYSCKLLTDDMELIMLVDSDPSALDEKLVALSHQFRSFGARQISIRGGEGGWRGMFSRQPTPDVERLVPMGGDARRVSATLTANKPKSVIVSGQTLAFILGDDTLQEQFLTIAMHCKAVVACRVSPPQKASLVRMVRKHVPGNPVTLAIGDGANDVAMIQQAEVGVGISGREGLQAVNSSDFAIAQFRFLAPLLLVHGRWSYRRMAKVFLYSFFKNVVITLTLFYFNLFTGWSGTSLYDSLVYSGYNFFLGLPIIAVGICDRDLSRETLLAHPSMYISGLYNMNLNLWKMTQWIIHALILSAVVFWIPYGAFAYGGVTWDPQGEDDGMGVAGLAIYTCMLFAMQLKVCEETMTFTKYNLYALAISIIGFFAFVLIYDELNSISPDFYYVAVVMFKRPAFWGALFLSLGVVMVLDFVAELFRKQFLYTPIEIGIEIERCLPLSKSLDVMWGDESKSSKSSPPVSVRVASGDVVSTNPVSTYSPPRLNAPIKLPGGVVTGGHRSASSVHSTHDQVVPLSGNVSQ